MSTDYDKQAEDFLKDTETSFKAVFLKNDIYFEDDKDKDKRDIYEITLTRGERTYTFTFGQSIVASGEYTYYGDTGRERELED